MKILVTYIPENSDIERSILDSIEYTLSLCDISHMIDLSLLINANKINISTKKNSISSSDLSKVTKYINEDNLLDELKKMCKTGKDIIILNGYNIDMKYIRENLYPLLLKNPELLFSINVITNDNDLSYMSSHVIELNENMTDEEWEDKEIDLIEELDKDIETYKNSSNMFSKLLSCFGYDSGDADIESSPSNNFIIKLNEEDIPANSKIENIDVDVDIENDNKYECITFTNKNSTITIEKDNKNITIIDNKGNKISLDDAAKNFLVNNLI